MCDDDEYFCPSNSNLFKWVMISLLSKTQSNFQEYFSQILYFDKFYILGFVFDQRIERKSYLQRNLFNLEGTFLKSAVEIILVMNCMRMAPWSMMWHAICGNRASQVFNSWTAAYLVQKLVATGMICGRKRGVKTAYLGSYTDSFRSSKKFTDLETAKVCSFLKWPCKCNIWKFCWLGKILAGPKTS